MDKSEAYKIVFDDLMQINLCKGIYDAQYKHKDFMHGIATVMENIAYNVSEKCFEQFCDTFSQNMQESEERRITKYGMSNVRE